MGSIPSTAYVWLDTRAVFVNPRSMNAPVYPVLLLGYALIFSIPILAGTILLLPLLPPPLPLHRLHPPDRNHLPPLQTIIGLAT